MEESPSQMSISSQSCSETTDDSMNTENSNNKDEYCGISISDLYHNKSPWNYFCPPLSPSKHHTVLFEAPVNLKDAPKPHYSSKATIWDSNHVKMPFSPSNIFPVKENGSDVLKPRWEVIQLALLQPIKNSFDLEKAILSYNMNLRRSKFNSLHYLFENVFSEEESDSFFTNLLPKIISLALRLPQLIKAPVPLLKQGKPHSLSLSQLQISSLLANAFLCTFPWKKDLLNYPGINFDGLYTHHDIASDPAILEKIKCIIHYFRRVCYTEPIGVLTFERKHLPRSQFPRWDKLEKSISNTKLHVTNKGTIEDGGLGMLQVDFANCMLGGGVLHRGCVQEEIRFVICPELIVSRLFTERLTSNEALLMIGAECYSNYTGYADSFEWSSNNADETPFDKYGRKRTSIIAIDAIPYSKSSIQFAPSKMIRELNKAYIGFCEHDNKNNLPLAPVATGNWGCGAFGGNLHLKALIQMIACTASNRNLVYYTFGDKKLQYAVFNIYNYLASNSVTVAQLWRYLCKFGESGLSKHQLLPFIKQCHIDSLNNLTEEKPKPTRNFTFNKSTNKQRSPSPSISTPRKTFKISREKEDCPSTSKEQTIKENTDEKLRNIISESDDDIIEDSQEEFNMPVSTFRSKFTKPSKGSPNKISQKSNKFKRMRDVASKFYSSDEEEQENEKVSEFLSKIDELSNKKKFNDSKMDVDSLISSDDDADLMEIVITDKKVVQSDRTTKISNQQKEDSKSRKPLITDYFATK